MDEPYSEPERASWRTVLARLVARAGWLMGIFCILLALMLVGELRPAGALVGFLLALAGLALVPAEQERRLAAEPVAFPPSLNEEEAIFAFADALADPCLVLDRRSQLVHANVAASRQFPALAHARPITFFLRNPELVQAIEQVTRGAVTRTVELHETIPSETWDKVVVSPLRRPGRDWLGDEDRQLVVTFQSLTELKRVEVLRSDFIANASHELRTPLASLLGFIDTLLGPAAKDAAAREKFLHIMRGQADRMSRLVDDLLSLSRIEMHQHVRPTGSIELGGLLREVREGLMTQAQAANVDIRLSLPDLPGTTIGDRGQLYEVFENLIDNAVKYGADGEYVEVSLAPAGRAGFQHLVTVVDHGPGVAPEHVPRLTERFYRIDAESSRRKKGTGLGLAIVKHIVHRHRGVLTLRSKPGEGLRVEVLLP